MTATAQRPPDLDPRPDGDSLGAVLWSQDFQWMARLRNRDVGEGTYKVCMSGWQGDFAPGSAPRVALPSPAATIS